MSPEKQREIASKGGRAAHQKGTAHEWSSDEARDAGRKGGMASRGGRGKLPGLARVLSGSERSRSGGVVPSASAGGRRMIASGLGEERSSGSTQPL